MKLAFTCGLAVLSALVTSLVLNAAAPALEPRAASQSRSSVFVAGAAVMVAADGSCHTGIDAGAPLLGTTKSQPEAVSAPAPAPAPQVVAADPPRGGSCGGHLDEASVDEANVDDANVDEANVDDAPAFADPDVPPSSDQEIEASESVAAEAALPAEESPRPSIKPRPSKPRAKRTPPPAETLTAWWPARRPDGLNVLFVGEVSFGSAISVLADGDFENADSANAHIEVRDAAGRPLDRRWQVATNRKMLLMLVEEGVYTVSIQPGLSDAQGRQIGAASSGPVYVR